MNRCICVSMGMANGCRDVGDPVTKEMHGCVWVGSVTEYMYVSADLDSNNRRHSGYQLSVGNIVGNWQNLNDCSLF